MSRKSSNKAGVVVQKPRSDVYTMMLIISLIAIIVGIVMLNLALYKYGPKMPQWKVTSISAPDIAPSVTSVWT